jgi:hypothetical protein
MSEYQYYEFRALDAPLTKADQTYLRSISSRADITSSSLTNEYEWGSFKGDPLKLMHRCFDLHVYWANWGTRSLMLKVPADAVDGPGAAAYAGGPGLTLDRAGGNVVVSFDRSPEDGYDEDFDLYDRAWADDLQPVRDLLLAGDPRPLYLGWLAGLADDAKPKQREPPVPPGLAALPEALEALVEYLGIDEDLLALAVEASPPAQAAGAGASAARADLSAGVPDLPGADKDAVLRQLLAGQAAAARAGLTALLRRRAGDAGDRPPVGVVTGRTVGELLAAADARAQVRAKAEAERKRAEAERRAAKAAEARAAHLKALAGRFDATWAEVEPLIRGGVSKYADAVTLLADLRDAAVLAGKQRAYADRLRALRSTFAKRSALIDRLRKAGLVPDGSGVA